jgi:hypothetical protein
MEELSPLTTYFRGTYLVDYLKQLVVYRRYEMDKERYSGPIRRTMKRIKENWKLFCIYINREDQFESWKDVLELVKE